jgi:hypothetical protein
MPAKSSQRIKFQVSVFVPLLAILKRESTQRPSNFHPRNYGWTNSAVFRESFVHIREFFYPRPTLANPLYLNRIVEICVQLTYTRAETYLLPNLYPSYQKLHPGFGNPAIGQVVTTTRPQRFCFQNRKNLRSSYLPSGPRTIKGLGAKYYQHEKTLFLLFQGSRIQMKISTEEWFEMSIEFFNSFQ